MNRIKDEDIKNDYKSIIDYLKTHNTNMFNINDLVSKSNIKIKNVPYVQDLLNDLKNKNIITFIDNNQKPSLNEFARIAIGLKLTKDWEEKWESLPKNIKLGVPYTRIRDYMKEHNGETVTLKDLALNANPNAKDTAGVNQQVRTLKKEGIIEETGYVEEPKPKKEKNPDSLRGRPAGSGAPKTIEHTIGLKLAKGNTDFTPEEKAFLKKLAK